jgi:hypothetical protein
MTAVRTGSCLCGAVRYKAATDTATLGACACDQCRRHTGSLLVGLGVMADAVRWDGVPATFRSSDWAERGFCPACGSTLFYRVTAGPMAGYTSLAAGSLDDLAGLSLGHEYFADACTAYSLAGDHARISRAETIAKFSGAGDA